VRLTLFNGLGQEIRQIIDAVQPAGVYQVVWDGRDARGLEVASGVYLYRLDAGSFLQTRRLVLLK
jgi:flagellar hook assembly protein FlgD